MTTLKSNCVSQGEEPTMLPESLFLIARGCHSFLLRMPGIWDEIGSKLIVYRYGMNIYLIILIEALAMTIFFLSPYTPSPENMGATGGIPV